MVLEYDSGMITLRDSSGISHDKVMITLTEIDLDLVMTML